MKITIDDTYLAQIEATMKEIPKSEPLEQWGLIYVCYNTLKHIRETAQKEAQETAQKEE